MSKVILVTGSGAALAFNIIEASNYTYKNMATFDEIDMGR